MNKLVAALGVLVAVLICESACQIIYPTYRPPPRPRQPVIMRARRSNGKHLWLYKDGNIPRAPSSGDHPFLPKYIDDIKLDPNRRVARSLGTPTAPRGGFTRPSSSRDTGPTHPGYNRRNARDLNRFQPVTLPPFNPRLPGPKYPWDTNPGHLPIYV